MDIQSFAAQLNSVSVRTSRSYEPCDKEAKFDTVKGIKAVFFDVYGTLIDTYMPEFAKEETRLSHILTCMEKVIEEFRLKDPLFDMDPKSTAVKTLRDLYHGLIFVKNQESSNKGVLYPEVHIEKIWEDIFRMAANHSYEIPQIGWDSLEEMALCAAYYYNFHCLGRRLYPGVYDLFKQLTKNNIIVGIISNAQFYTLIDLSYLLSEQSSFKVKSIRDYIDEDLCFFSYQYGFSKPNPLLFAEAINKLSRRGITAYETLYVGNDMRNDIVAAAEAGMRTALFTGDKETTRLCEEDPEIKEAKPDLSVSQLLEVAYRIM